MEEHFEFVGDPTVSMADGTKWFAELINEAPLDFAERYAEVEPAVAGTAIEISRRTRKWLEKAGAPKAVIDHVSRKIILAGMMCAEMQRRGHAKLWSDFVDEDPKEKGDKNE